jgi:UDP-glucose-4-epimerase GalE
MKRVLVTGGAGYVGSHACKALADAGYEPVVFDNLVYGHEWAVQWGPFEQGDILDTQAVTQVLERYRPDAVMHFAAYAYVGESVTDPEKYYSNNVGGTLSLLRAMRELGVNRFIFSSTCATYGVPDQVPIPVEHEQAPINPYGRSKLMIEQVMEDYAAAYGMGACALRYFNAAGADPDGLIGESHDPETHLIPNVLRAATGDLEYLSIYGDDYDTTDGTCVRDYIHVTDLADAHVLAMQHLASREGEFAAFNLGTESGHSVKAIVDAARRVTGRDIPVRIVPRRAGDPPVLVADATLARQVLGWTPRLTGIDDIVSTAWQWHQRPLPQTGNGKQSQTA